MRCFSSTYLLALSVLLTGAAMAEEGLEPEGQRRERDGKFREKIVEEFDADGDGRLNEDERAVAREEMRARRGGEGRRGRGRGGPDGPRAGGERAQGSRELGPPERGREGRRGPKGHGGPGGTRPPGPEEMFDRFDANGDDQLSRDEFMQLADMVRKRHQHGGLRGARGPRGEFGDRGSRGDSRARGDDGKRRGGGKQGRRAERRGPRGGDEDFRRPERPASETQSAEAAAALDPSN